MTFAPPTEVGLFVKQYVPKPVTLESRVESLEAMLPVLRERVAELETRLWHAHKALGEFDD